MLNYELIYIVSSGIKEDELPKVISKIGDLISKVGGNVVEVVQWGRKKLAYPIKKSMEGNYILAKIEMVPIRLKEFDANIKLYDEILRYLVIKKE